MQREGILRKLREWTKSSDAILGEYVRRLAELYPRSTIVLFGSRARGDHLPYSDYDLMIILESSVDKVEEAARARSVKPPELPADILVISVDELGDPLIAEMLRRGYRVLHDGLGLASRIKQIAGAE